jgi:trigger factor
MAPQNLAAVHRYRRKETMNVKSVEKAENNTAKLVLEFDKVAFENALNQAYKNNRKDILVPGFRKGKAPRKVVEGMYGATIFYEDAVNILFPDAYAEATKSSELKTVGQPSITDLQVEEDGSLVLTVESALYPEVTLGQYKGLEVEKEEVSVSDSEVEAELNRMRERNARITTVDRPIQDGDTAVIDFEGFENGVAFEGGKGENYSLKIGSGSFVPGFEDGLIGVSAGEEKDVELTFPEDYTPELAGKPVVFKCKVHEVKETQLPDLDDEFAKDVSEFDTLDEVRADIRKNLTASKEASVNSDFANACVEAAAKNMTVEIPEAMVQEQLDHVMKDFDYQLQMNGMNLNSYAQMLGMDAAGMRNNMRSVAENQVRGDLLLAKIAEVEGIEVSAEEIEEQYKQMADESQMTVEQLKVYYAEDELKTGLTARKAAKVISDSAVAVAPKAPEAPAEDAAE